MDIILPLIVVSFVSLGIIKKVGVFDCFTQGAKEGIFTIYTIAPTLIGLITAVSMLRASGAVEALTALVSPVAEKLGFPAEIVPAALLRPISGSGSTALVLGIFEDLGPDSFAGRIVSVMAGSTETTIYAIALYYGSVGIKNARHTLVSGLTADFTAMVFSVLCERLM